jgi:hypothetical protein
MKKSVSIINWLFPISALVVLILAMIWVQNLSIPDTDHQWFSVGLIGIFCVLMNAWINKHPDEFLVDDPYIQYQGHHSKKDNE